MSEEKVRKQDLYGDSTALTGNNRNVYIPVEVSAAAAKLILVFGKDFIGEVAMAVQAQTEQA